MKDNILAVLNAGHDVGSIAYLTVFEADDGWMVEVFDPKEEDDPDYCYCTKEFSQYLLDNNFTRQKDICHRLFPTAEEAVDAYLTVHGEMKRQFDDDENSV